MFSSGVGAVLAMDNEVISVIDTPGSLRRLLSVEAMRDCVVVTQVHRCSSYARLLTTDKCGGVVVGLGAQPPIPVGSLSGDVQWAVSRNVGNFKSNVNKNGDRDFYPLFRLVSLRPTALSDGLRRDHLDEEESLPDAIPPWRTEERDLLTRNDSLGSLSTGTSSSK